MALSKKVAIVTGASRGIGAATAVELCRVGADVCILARSREELRQTEALCKQARTGARVVICDVDVTDKALLLAAVTRCELELGSIDIAIHAAGISGAQPSAAADDAWFKRVLDVNLFSGVELARLVLPGMLARSQGAIVFVSSILARQQTLSPGQAAYVASKMAVAGYISALFAEARAKSIKVSCIYPGLVNTGMGADFQKEFGSLIDRSLSGTDLLQSEDVAQAIVYAVLPRPSCIHELTIEPTRDVARLSVYTEPAAIEAIRSSPAPPPPAAPTALITGAGRGIGRSVAVALAKRGFNLGLIARTQGDLDEAAAECRAARPGVVVKLFPITVRDRAALSAAVDEVAKDGSLTVVVSNAGTNRRKSVAVADVGVWEEVLDTNLLSAMFLTRIAMPHLLRHAHRTGVPSHVIFVNTTLAPDNAQAIPGVAPYVTSKAGLAGFARVAHADVRDFGVKVSTIFPGLVNTVMGVRQGPVEKLRQTKVNPAAIIQPEEIAECVLFIIDARPNASVTSIAIHSQQHHVDAIRRHGEKFLAQHDKPAKL
eukprot:m.88059 g.88059  ORF g.88059 m.88059 type:complete len:544 (+) comp8349_c1_seq1:125-1756(+)